MRLSSKQNKKTTTFKHKFLITIFWSFAFLAIWQITVSALNIPIYLLPTPLTIFQTAITVQSELLINTIYTFAEALCGLLLALCFSILLAIIMDKYPKPKQIISRFLIISQTVPLIAIAPLFLIWFGYGFGSKVLLITTICLFPITINLLSGFEKINPDYLLLFNLMKANDFQKYWYLKLPASFSELISGLKIAITYSITGAIFAEYIGANIGLGKMLKVSLASFNNPLVFAIVIIIVVLTLSLIGCLKQLERKVNYEKNKY